MVLGSRRCSLRWGRVLALLAVIPGSTPAGAGEAFDRVAGVEAEELLLTAEVIEVERIPVGVTRPKRVTLTDGVRTIRAVWKTLSEYSQVREFYDGRPAEIGFRDSYKSEIAAYELDRLLGLGLVPPTVQRKIGKKKGSLQLWLEGTITEAARRERGLKPRDIEAWEQQNHNVRLFHQLIYDADYENQENLVVDEDFRLWVVDHSRAFRHQANLLESDSLERFSGQHLERLRELTAEVLEARLGQWLTSIQRRGLLARRNLIVERADRLVGERGRAAVIF